jgi:hypothetical protein
VLKIYARNIQIAVPTIKHERILELYELTAGDSVGSAYLKNANDEQTEANTWRDKSIYFIVGTAIRILFQC